MRKSTSLRVLPRGVLFGDRSRVVFRGLLGVAGVSGPRRDLRDAGHGSHGRRTVPPQREHVTEAENQAQDWCYGKGCENFKSTLEVRGGCTRNKRQ